MNFEETTLQLRGYEFCTLEKNINKTNIVLMVMMIISYLEPPLYTSSTRVFIALFMHKTMGLEPWFWGHGFAYDMHNPWV